MNTGSVIAKAEFSIRFDSIAKNTAATIAKRFSTNYFAVRYTIGTTAIETAIETIFIMVRYPK